MFVPIAFMPAYEVKLRSSTLLVALWHPACAQLAITNGSIWILKQTESLDGGITMGSCVVSVGFPEPITIWVVWCLQLLKIAMDAIR